MKTNEIKRLLDPLEGLVFRNAKDFCTKFCSCTNVMELVAIRFSSASVEFVYVSDNGQHFADDMAWSEFEPWLEEMRVKEEIKLWITEYIAAKEAQAVLYDTLTDAVTALNSGEATDFEPIAMPYYRFIEDTFVHILGDDNHEWIEWYLYDNRYKDGRRGGKVVIDGHEYDISRPEHLIETCLNLNEVDRSFFGETK